MIVTGCNDCPLAVSDEAAEHCYHPESPDPAILTSTEGRVVGREYVPAAYVTPDWCPLRTATLTLVLQGCDACGHASHKGACPGLNDSTCSCWGS